MASKPTFHRLDVLEAAKQKFCTCGGHREGNCRCGMKYISFEEVGGSFRIRTVGGPIRELVVDGVRHLVERDVKTLAGPFTSLADAAKFFGVAAR